MKTIFQQTIGALASCILAFSAQAELIFSESFYDLDEGWIASQSLMPGSLQKSSLRHAGNFSRGGKVAMNPKIGEHLWRYHRSLGEGISEGDVWMSYLFTAKKVGKSGFCVALHDRNISNSGSMGHMGVGKTTGKLFSIGNHSVSRIPIVDGKVYWIVAHYDLKAGGDRIKMWINPPLNQKPNPRRAAVTATGYDLGTLNDIVIDARPPSLSPKCFDEIRVSRTWEGLLSLPAGPTRGEITVISEKVDGPFYASLKFPNMVRDLSVDDFNVKNGKVTKLYGVGRKYSLLIDPRRQGTVSLKLKPGSAKGIARNPKVSVSMSPVAYKRTSSPRIAPKFIQSKMYHVFHPKKVYTDWLGKRVILRVDRSLRPEMWSQMAMAKIVSDLDRLYQGFEEITGQKKSRIGLNNGRILITVPRSNKRVSVGKEGSEFILPRSDFRKIYDRAAEGRTPLYPSSIVELIARDFEYIELDLRIGYRVSRSKVVKWWSSAFAKVTASMIAKENDFELESDSAYWLRLLETYMGKDSHNWFRCFNAASPPWNREASLDELMAGLLLHLCNKHGGKEMLKKMYVEIEKLEVLKNSMQRAAARDNFAIAVSQAAGRDLTDYFNEKLKWPVSTKVTKVVKR